MQRQRHTAASLGPPFVLAAALPRELRDLSQGHVPSAFSFQCGLEAAALLPHFSFEEKLFHHDTIPFAPVAILHGRCPAARRNAAMNDTTARRGPGSPCSCARRTVIVWVLLILIYRYGEWHHRRSRLQGFLAFYRHTQALRRMPVLTLSAGVC